MTIPQQNLHDYSTSLVLLLSFVIFVMANIILLKKKIKFECHFLFFSYVEEREGADGGRDKFDEEEATAHICL